MERITPRLQAEWGKRELTKLIGEWHLWIHANVDFTDGTLINLKDDGTIERVIVNRDGTEDVFVVKSSKDDV